MSVFRFWHKFSAINNYFNCADSAASPMNIITLFIKFYRRCRLYRHRIFLVCALSPAAVLLCSGQAPGAQPYLADILKYNEASNFEDARYKVLDWRDFDKLEEANELVDPNNYDFDLMNAAVFYAVNKFRSAKNLPPLKFDGRLRDAASIHSWQMVKKNFFDHMDFYDDSLRSPDRRMMLCGYSGQKMTENISRIYLDRSKPLTYIQVAAKIAAEWSKSKDQNHHMLDPELERLGCGLVFEVHSNLQGLIYFRVTADFGKDFPAELAPPDVNVIRLHQPH